VQALLAAVVGDPLVPWAAEGREGGAACRVRSSSVLACLLQFKLFPFL
jgi:hypothetical protein